MASREKSKGNSLTSSPIGKGKLAGMATGWDISTKTPEQLSKWNENGYISSCVVCGSNEPLEELSVSWLNLLIKTGTISSGLEASQTSICSRCSSSVTMMEQAGHVQANLSERFQLRNRNGMNGVKKTSITAQLVKPGHEVNMPGDVDGRCQLSEIDDFPQLSICDVKGGVELSECNESEDTPILSNLEEMEIPVMECEVDNDAGLAELFDSPCGESGVEYTKPPTPSHVVSDAVSRWLPTTSSVSERSFGSSFTDSTTSSSGKERPQSSWKCPMCAETFESSSILVSHVHSAHSASEVGETMSCPFCTKTFPTYTQLDDHMTQMHGDGTHSCQGCFSVFLRPTLLRSHKQYCSGYKKYKEELRLSANCHSNRAEFSCPHCLLNMSDQKCSTKHIEECRTRCLSKKYNCEGCLAGFDTLERLFSHQAECEFFYDLESLCSDYSVELRCQGCRASLSDCASFVSHRKNCPEIKNLLHIELETINHVDNGSPSAPSSSSDGQSQPGDPPWCIDGSSVCSECGISYKDEADLAIHKQSVHQDADYCPLKCNGCRGGFISIESLKTHLQMCKHSTPNESSFPCPECLTQHQYKCLLEFHKEIHKNAEEKPFRCSGCEGGFVAKTHKVSHEQKCGKFKMKMWEKERIQTSVGAKSPKCEKETLMVDKCVSLFCCKLCSKEFAYLCDLKRHLCTQKKKKKRDAEASCLVSSQQDEAERIYHAELISSIDFKAAEVLCPICFIDLQTSESDTFKSRCKRNVTRHMKGHEKSFYKRMSCPGCMWGSPYPGRRILLKHATHCRLLREKFPTVEFNATEVHCPICLIKFGSIAECTKHFSDHHVSVNKSAQGRFICDGCRGHYSSKVDLDSHVSQCLLHLRALSVLGVGVACGICSVRFTTGEKYNSHFEENHKIVLSSVVCSFCAEKFKSLDDVISHVNTDCPLAHSIISCSIFSLTNGESTTVSEVDDKEEQLAAMNECNDKDSEIFSYKNGRISKKSMKSSEGCGICGVSTFSKDKLAKHMLIHTEKESRPYHCKACDGGFTQLHLLAAHEDNCMRRKRGGFNSVHVTNSTDLGNTSDNIPSKAVENSTDVPTNIEISVSTVKRGVLLACSTCDKQFDSDVQLAEHLLSVHRQPLHQCDTCQKSFDHEETLTEHKLHCNSDTLKRGGSEGDDKMEEWKCLSCCIKYTHELSFLLHIASHEVTTVSRCYLCPATFKCAADICMHMVKYHKTYLMTGIKEGLQDDSDKDSDEDSDIEVESVVSKSSQVLAQVTERSPRSTSRARTPVRSGNVTDPDKAITSPPARDDYARPTVSSFKHNLLQGTKCPVCNREFATNEILRRHYGIHDGYHNSVCLTCGSGFCKIALLRKHKSRVHRTPKANDLVCERCSGAFDHSFRLQKHQEVCICPKNEKVLQCLFCVRTFDSLQQLKSHSWTHLTKCSFCDDKFSVQSRRVDHMMTCAKNPLHAGKAPTAQVSVPSVISSPPPQKVYNKRGPKPKNKPIEKKKYKCKDCCSEYATMKSLKRHEVVHEQAEYRCRVCGGKFSSLLAKNKHILREHESATRLIKAAPRPDFEPFPEPEVEPEPEEPKQNIFFLCTFCTTCFDSTAERDQHVKEQHGQRQAFDCRHCDKRFGSKFARRRHLQTAHSSQSSQPPSLVCHLCSKRFPSNFAKSQHMKRIHKLTDAELAPPKRKKVCKVCGESFDHKSELKAHKRSVHQQNLLINGSIDLSADMLRLEDNKPGDLVFSPPKVRACKQCDMTFARKAELKAHCRTVHSQSSQQSFTELPQMQLDGNDSVVLPADYSSNALANGEDKGKIRMCKDCGKTYPTKNELKAHRKAEHKERKLSHLRVDGETLQLLQEHDPSTAVKHSLPAISTDSEQNGPPPKLIKLETPETVNITSAEEKLPFHCEHCSKGFKLRISLNKHMTRAHPWIP